MKIGGEVQLKSLGQPKRRWPTRTQHAWGELCTWEKCKERNKCKKEHDHSYHRYKSIQADRHYRSKSWQQSLLCSWNRVSEYYIIWVGYGWILSRHRSNRTFRGCTYLRAILVTHPDALLSQDIALIAVPNTVQSWRNCLCPTISAYPLNADPRKRPCFRL